MNIFQPYELLADAPECLHLKETAFRERMHFIVFRVFPILMLLFVWFIIFHNQSHIPMGWNYLIIFSGIHVTAILFFRSYITEIKITGSEIYIVRKTVSGVKEITISIHDVEKITFRRRRGKAVGAFFVLQTKTKESYSLLNIPQLFVDDHHIELIRERLGQMLHTEVTER